LFTVRASQAPLAVQCGQSQRGELQVAEPDSTAALGSATHHILARWIGSGDWLQPDQVAALYGCDQEELAYLAEAGRSVWQRLRQFYPAPLVEQRLSAELSDSLTLTGTIDVASMLPNGVRVLDWKTGRIHRDYRAQLLAYASLATRAFGVDRAAVSIIYLRDADPREEWTLTRKDLEEFEARLVASLTSETYNIGDHCAFCLRAHSCPGRRALVSGAVGSLVGAAEPLSAVIAGGRLGDLLDVCRAVETAAVRIRGELKEMAKNGPIRSNGTTVSLTQRERRSVDVKAGWGVLREWLGDDLAGALAISLPDAQRVVAERTTRGSKGARKAAFAAALDEAGAIRRQTYDVLEITKEAEDEGDETGADGAGGGTGEAAEGIAARG
jgi:hypothetical protein